MEAKELSELIKIHERFGIIFLNQAIEAEALGDSYRASKMALYAWAHFRHAETTSTGENHLGTVNRDYINNPSRPLPFDYDPVELLNIASSFARYMHIEEQVGTNVIKS